MSIWEEVYLGDICDTISETYKSKTEKVVLINTSDVLDGKVLNHHFVANLNLKGQFKKCFQADDILYSEIRPKNKRFAYVGFNAQDYIASTKLMVIRSRKNKVLPEFLFQVLKSDTIIEKLQLLAETRSGTFPQITFSEVANIKIMLPTLEEQKEIARILTSIDDKIDLNIKINDNLAQLARAIYKKIGTSANSSIRFTDIVQVLGGGTPKTTVSSYWDGSIPFFTPKDVCSTYVITTEKSITEDGLKHCNSRLYPINTVFVTARGTVGKVSLAGCDMAMNQSCYALIGKSGYGQFFTYHLSLDVIDSLKNKANGAVFDAIVTRDFESENIVVPDVSTVATFEQMVSTIYDAILLNEQENVSLIAMRNTLLPKLMSGELDVSQVTI